MTTKQVVETSVTLNDNSPIQDYVHPDDQTQPFEMIENVTKFKCLGVIINQHLTWHDHIDHEKLQSKIAEIRRLKTNQASSPSLCKKDLYVNNGNSYS